MAEVPKADAVELADPAAGATEGSGLDAVAIELAAPDVKDTVIVGSNAEAVAVAGAASTLAIDAVETVGLDAEAVAEATPATGPRAGAGA